MYMGKIDDRIIQQVLDATDIVEVVGEFVELKKKGARYIGLCPFHDDRHATNFVVYPAKKCYRCFACDAKGDAVKFLMENQGMSFVDAIRWLGKKAKIDVDDVDVSVEVKKRELPPPLPTLYLPDSMVKHSMQRRCNFHTWLCSLPWNDEQRRRVESVIEEYFVGATKQGFALFWQLDESTTARTGHCMKYQDDGHRVKEGYATDWIHTMLRRSGKYPQYAEDKVEMRQTLFGMHLLNKYPGAEVHIVESEKTALICATYFGEPERHLWMACCGKYNITSERLAPLVKERRVIALHPDKDGREEWTEKMKELGYQRAYINDTILTLQWKPEDGDKADIADVLLRLLKEKTTRRMPLTEIMDVVPAIRTTYENTKRN